MPRTTDYRTDTTAWMRYGACLPAAARKLPWLKDGQEVTASEERRLQATCISCPVLTECSRFADGEHLTGGFWAGVHREHRGTSGGQRRGRRAA